MNIETESKGKWNSIPANYIAGQAILRDIQSRFPIQKLRFRTQNLFSDNLFLGINIQKWNEPITTSYAIRVNLSGAASQWFFLIPDQLKSTENICEDIYDESYLKMILNEGIWGSIAYQEAEDFFETLLSVKYKSIPEVKAIYIDEYLDEKNITILISVKQYDDKLMETLIQKELDISKVLPDVVTTYNYIPDIIDDKESIIGKKAKLIFER